MHGFKSVLFIICFVFSIFIFTGFVSAASLNITEIKQASTSVKNYTESKSDIPGYVVVSNKNSSAPSFLKTTTTWTIQLNNGVINPVTISNVNNPTGPSGSATGTLSKSEYLTIATNIENYITTNGRAPNYASSSLGNIRYESLVYAYSKILDFYKTNDRLPDSVSVVNIVGVSGGVLIPSLDYTPPTVTANPTGGTYTHIQTVTLTATDNKDLHPSIYYTTDGTTPTTSSTLYTTPINININTTLKFMARDSSGNQAAVQTMNYIINRVTDITTNRSYSTIQNAINDTTTLNGDIIQVRSGTFIENLVITKSLTLMPFPENNVTIQAMNTSKPVITLNCDNSTIQGFTIMGATNSYGIYLDSLNEIGMVEFGKNNNITGNTITNNKDGVNSRYSSNNTIQENNISNNSQRGIYFFQSTNNIMKKNIITNNGDSGIEFEYHSDSNSIEYNKIDNNTTTGNGCGLTIYYSDNNVIKFNNIINNTVGLHFVSGSAIVNYNRIALNDYFGLKSLSGAVINATNNWWGTNNPTTSYSQGDILILDGGIVNYNPYLVLNINVSRTNTSGHYIINADLTRNNNGDNTSSSGYIPDEIPISFNTTFGTIESFAYTNKGKAESILSFPSQGEANITVTLDTHNITTIVINGVYNQNTQITFTNIQEAINDSTTSPGDTIILDCGNYNENIIINKKINLIPGISANPTIIGTITVNSGGNGTTIEGLTINGNINLNANNCTIINNTIIGNGISAIILNNSTNTTIADNTITSNGFNGIQTIGSSINIYGNKIYNCVNGIYSENSNNIIKSNTIINNTCGIYTYNSTDTIQFNRITQNIHGLKNEIGTINATNNWWGSNTPIVSSSIPSDIYNVTGTVNYNPYLVLSVNVSSTNSGENTSVTADLTHNNQGADTSSQGHIPNGIPVNFVTNNGTIVNTAYTVKGQALTILNLNSLQPQNVTVSASTDSQSVSTTGIISTGSAILNITSTAVDNSTGQPLNITYTIPLNNSVTWLSVVWINTGMFTDEVQIIVDGIVVQDKYFNNTAYITWQNTYSTSVFNAIKYVNYHLPFIDSDELTTFWNNLTTTYNLTSTELEFIQNHSQDFIDDLTVNIVYPGVSGFNLTVTDPDSNVIDLNFPGNIVQRTSKVIYIGSPGEGVKSFAIATTNVTDEVLQYWQNQYPSYQTDDAMNVAYNTFITALMIEYAHDRIADNMTTPLNVTWSRTSPVIVSVGEDPYQIYETLECDHSMGMTVIGTIENMWTFNYVTSSYISFIENDIMSSAYNSTFSSVTMELNYLYNNYNIYVETFQYNDFIMMKSTFNSFIVIDLETGLVRDIDTVNNLYGGRYTFGGRIFDYGAFFQPKEIVTTIAYKTLIGYKFYVWQIGTPWDLGPLTFAWDKQNIVYISGNGMFLADIMADNKLTITGPKGSKIVEGTQEPLDITDILDENALNQTLNFVLEDTDGGFIATSPLYIVESILEAQNRDLTPVFPTPTPTWPDADDLPKDPHKQNPGGYYIPLYKDRNGNTVYLYVYVKIDWNGLYT